MMHAGRFENGKMSESIDIVVAVSEREGHDNQLSARPNPSFQGTLRDEAAQRP
jgi:hypothetical protein